MIVASWKERIPRDSSHEHSARLAGCFTRGSLSLKALCGDETNRILTIAMDMSKKHGIRQADETFDSSHFGEADTVSYWP